MRKHRRLRRKRNKKQPHLIIGMALALLFVFTAGYAAFGTNISINAKGNLTTEATCTLNHEWTYDYENTKIYDLKIPCNGTYKLETWGASGGYAYDSTRKSGNGGYGGYSIGTIKLKRNQKLYIVVGGEGESNCQTKLCSGGYNGGSNSSKWANGDGTGLYTGGGGGATHIAQDNKRGTLDNYSDDREDILMVSGGGGGGDYYPSWNRNSTGGSGGGFVGGDRVSENGENRGNGGTQTSGYAFGKAGTTYTNDSVGGSGGGYYGGISNNIHYTGAGGSGYIGNNLLSDKSMYCYGCEESLELTKPDIFTVSTTGTSSYKDTINCPNGYSETPISKCAKKGNGYAKITLISIG